MTTERDRTVWFPKDTLLGLILMIPIWGIAGLVWGVWMIFMMGGSTVGWLIGSVFWGALMWVGYSIFIVIYCREITTSIPVTDAATLPEWLTEAVKPLRYTVRQSSPTSFVCESKQGLGRFISLEYSKIHVVWEHGLVVVTGPAGFVNKLKKKLLVNKPTG